jgi:hypothetical protein
VSGSQTQRPSATCSTTRRGRASPPSGALGLPSLREHLRVIGLGRERPEVFVSTPQRRRIRVHDLRGTFVTVALANGKSETWVADRTGHKSSTMINRYRRAARSFAELQAGELSSLYEAIPELSITPRLPTTPAKYAKHEASPAGFEDGVPDPQPLGTTEIPQKTVVAGPRSSPIVEPRGQSVANEPASDPVESALAEALRRAAEAGQWSTVEILSRELTARREARAGVIQLAALRQSKGRP